MNVIMKSIISLLVALGLSVTISAYAGCPVFVPTTTTYNGVTYAAPVVANATKLQVGNNSYITSATGTLATSGNGTSMTTTLGVGPPGQALPAFTPTTFPTAGATSKTLTNGGAMAPGNYTTVKADNSVTVTLAAGDYFINEFLVGNNFVLNVSSGPVRLYIKTKFQAGNQSTFNVGGNTANLQIYVYDGAQVQFGDANNGNSNVDFNGLIYAPGSNTKVQFGNNNIIQGAVLTGGTVDLGNNTGVIFDTATQNAIGSILVESSVGVCHYELSMPSTDISCIATPVTIKACADTSSPCTNASTLVNGKTATLAASAGTLGATTVTFNALGEATTTLAHPAAGNGAVVTVTLSGEQVAGGQARQCCPDGVGCVAANSCSVTLSTAGFIFSAAANGVEATLPTQTAGTSSGSYYLRAVKTNTSTMACQAALTGTQTVNMSYQCNNPATCYAANLMAVNGASATTIARNNNGSTASSSGVSLTFDANGNAPFTFAYGDVGQVTLFANKPAGGTLLTSLTGSTNPFVVKPAGFAISNIKRTSDNVVNPGAVDAAGAAFAKAGEAFTATVTAVGSTGNPVFSFGREASPAGVTLTSNLVSPAAGNNPALANNVIDGASFVNGAATLTNLSWGEVGIITMTADLTGGNYLGTGLSATGVSGNVGRFYPDHFDTTVTGPMACAGLTFTTACPAGGLAYAGQPFTTIVTAKNAAGVTTQNYSGSYAKPVTLSAWNASGGAVAAGGAMASNTIVAAAFASGVATAITPSYQFPVTPTAPADVFIRAVETAGDGVTSLRTSPAVSVEGGFKAVSGRVLVSNAYGSELLPLSLTAVTQYFDGTSWLTNTADSMTPLTLAANYNVVDDAGTVVGLTVPAPTGVVTVANGVLAITLGLPSGGTTGKTSINPAAPAYLPLTTGTATFGVYSGNAVFIYRGRHGR